MSNRTTPLPQMTENEKRQDPIREFLAEAEEVQLLALLDYLEEKIPTAYRVELLSFLLPRAIPGERDLRPPAAPAIADAVSLRPAAARSVSEEDEHFVDLEACLALLARRGDTLLKALAVLRFAELQLKVRWLTPSEIVRIIAELSGAHAVYRSNVSNVLRKEKALVSRRPRGRGYEYGLTKPGRVRVERELNLVSIDR